MCNLYTMTATVEELRRLFGALDGDRANLAIRRDLPRTRRASASTHWQRRTQAGDDDLGIPRAGGGQGATGDDVRKLDSSFWRSALTSPDRRCIVPANRFSEWTAEPDSATRRKSKTWFGLHEEDDPLFAFAGIWRPGEGGPYMASLTCDANKTVGAVHPKAMPVILRASCAIDWLSHREQACALAVPFPDTDMRRIDVPP